MSSKVQKERERLQRAFVAVFKASREDKDMSRRDLAEAMGLTYSQIVNIENGRREVTAVDFVLLGRAIDKDPAELLRRVLNW